MTDMFQTGLTTLLISLVLTGLVWLVSRSRKAALAPLTHRIAPSPGLTIGVGIGSVAMAVLILWLFSFQRGQPDFADRLVVVAMVTGFGGGGLAMFSLLSPRYVIAWSDRTMTGPLSIIGIPPFGPARGTIAFADIDHVGTDRLGNFYVADAAGRRLRWNWVYGGYPALMLAIETARPDLFPKTEPDVRTDQ